MEVARRKKGDKIYYNIQILYNSENRVDLECQGRVLYESTQSILDRADDWYMSVVSFSIPLSSVPLFFAQPLKYPCVDVNVLDYQVGLSFGNTFVQKPLIYLPQDLKYSQPSPATLSERNVKRSLYYGIWNYSWFVKLINTAIESAFADISTSPGFPTTYAPRLSFNQDGSNTFTITADWIAYEQTVVLYFSESLLLFFEGFTYKYNVPNGFVVDASLSTTTWNAVQFLDNDNIAQVTVPINTLEIKQRMDFPIMSNWPSMRSIQLRSDSMPINPEWLPASGTGSSGNPSYSRVLAEFTPQYTDSAGGSVPRSVINYSATGSWRLISMLDSQALKSVSLSCFWIDDQNNDYQIVLQSRERISLKLCFHDRATYRG